MDDKLQKAFDKVHANPDTTERTRAAMYQAIRAEAGKHVSPGASRSRRWNRRFARTLVAMASAACLLLGVAWYAGSGQTLGEAAYAISLDGTSSVELLTDDQGVVVSAAGWDGISDQQLDALELTGMSYDEGLRTLSASGFLEVESMVVTVTGEEASTCENMACAVRRWFRLTPSGLVIDGGSPLPEEARAAGLSCGKYRIFLDIQALEPSFTVEEAAGMSGRELHQLLAEYQGVSGPGAHGAGSGGEGNGNGAGQGNGDGQGNGSGGGTQGNGAGCSQP